MKRELSNNDSLIRGTLQSVSDMAGKKIEELMQNDQILAAVQLAGPVVPAQPPAAVTDPAMAGPAQSPAAIRLADSDPARALAADLA